jgi:hypothetical protein
MAATVLGIRAAAVREPWWFVSGVRAWHAIALVESPLAFRKRGVFLTSSALERV